MVSIYKEFKKVSSDIEITEVIECIKNGDYKEDINGSQFSIKNPNATTTCGCGSSFSA